MPVTEDERSAATLDLVRAYQTLLGQGRQDEWIELWAEDAPSRDVFPDVG